MYWSHWKSDVVSEQPESATKEADSHKLPLTLACTAESLTLARLGHALPQLLHPVSCVSSPCPWYDIYPAIRYTPRRAVQGIRWLVVSLSEPTKRSFYIFLKHLLVLYDASAFKSPEMSRPEHFAPPEIVS